MIEQNITNYLVNLNSTITEYYVEIGASCEVQTKEMFGVLIRTINYSLFCASLLLLVCISLYVLLEWYKHKKMKGILDIDKMTDFINSIDSIQRIILFACFGLSAWLFQIAIWGLG